MNVQGMKARRLHRNGLFALSQLAGYEPNLGSLLIHLAINEPTGSGGMGFFL